MNTNEGFSNYMTPTQVTKDNTVRLLFECIDLGSKRYDDEKRQEFIEKVRAVSILLGKYTMVKAREDLQKWYKQLKDELTNIDNASNYTSSDKNKMKTNLEYKYAKEVNEQNIKVFMMSPIFEEEAEGEMDIVDEDIISMVRMGKRTDDGRITAQ